MADCLFELGSIIAITTCFDQKYNGEVLAFDHNTRMLILKCSSSSASEDLNDVYVLNLSFCSDVRVINEPNNPVVDGPQKLNLEQLKIKLRNNVDQRQRWVKSNNADVSLEGQELYRAIAKHFKNQEVTWNGLNIQIFDEVKVSPPYRVDNVTANPKKSNPKLFDYIKKMVEKYYETSAQANNNASTSSTSSTSSPSPVPAN